MTPTMRPKMNCSQALMVTRRGCTWKRRSFCPTVLRRSFSATVKTRWHETQALQWSSLLDHPIGEKKVMNTAFKNFPLGRTVATPDALDSVAPERILECLARHAR